jgi:FkbM family methyltransferase
MEARVFLGLGGLPAVGADCFGPGDWVIDIGANVGGTTGEMCRRVGVEGRVWALEPVSRNVNRLEELKSLNGLDQLTVFAVAASAEKGTATMSLPVGGFSGHWSFHQSALGTARVEVRTTTVDDLIRSSVVEKRVRFIKIDVEGHELEVLAGAAKTLADHRPLICCEVNAPLLRERGSSTGALLGAFRDVGFELLYPLKQDREVDDALFFPRDVVPIDH